MLRLESTWTRIARWLSAVMMIATVHGAAWALAFRNPPPDEWDSQTGGAFIVELSAITSTPEQTNRDVAVGKSSEEVAPVAPSAPRAASAASEQPDEQPALPEITEPPPDDAIQKRTEEVPPEEQKPSDAKAAEAEDAPTVAPVAASEAAAPQQIDNAVEKAETARGLNAGTSRLDRAAIQNWQRDLIAHMNRYKRYPDAARQSRKDGVVSVAFAIDRGGQVLRATIVKSAGFDALDRAAIEMLNRASPLPPPPNSMAGEAIEFIIPVRFRWKT
jgi:protein TonB